jgi:hypothetical protein
MKAKISKQINCRYTNKHTHTVCKYIYMLIYNNHKDMYRATKGEIKSNVSLRDLH